MHRTLLVIGGVLNTALALFHVQMGIQLHRLAGVSPGLRALMEMLNAGGTLMIAFFAVASFAAIPDLLATRLGKLVLGLVTLLYASRALEEVILSPRFSAPIFAVCVLIAALYLAVLVLPRAARPAKVTQPERARA